MNVETDLMSVDPVEAEIKQARSEFLTDLRRKLSGLAKDYFNSDYGVAEWMARRDKLIASRLDTAVKLGVEDIVLSNRF